MILESAASFQDFSGRLFRISPQFYHEAAELGYLNEDVELLDGLIIRKMPKSPFHQWIVRYLSHLLATVVADHHSFVAIESPITTEFSEPEPDIALIAGDRLDYREQHPDTALLVIEVAVTSLLLDREKRSIYSGCGVEEYWIVDVQSKSIEIFTKPSGENQKYLESSTVPVEGTAKSKTIPGFQIELKELFSTEEANEK